VVGKYMAAPNRICTNCRFVISELAWLQGNI